MNKEKFIEASRKSAIIFIMIFGTFLCIIQTLLAPEHKLSVLLGSGLGVAVILVLTETKLFDILVGKLYDRRFK